MKAMKKRHYQFKYVYHKLVATYLIKLLGLNGNNFKEQNESRPLRSSAINIWYLCVFNERALIKNTYLALGTHNSNSVNFNPNFQILGWWDFSVSILNPSLYSVSNQFYST